MTSRYDGNQKSMKTEESNGIVKRTNHDKSSSSSSGETFLEDFPSPVEDRVIDSNEGKDDLRQVLLNRCNPSLMETLLMQKMARASGGLFVRSNSVSSVDSNCSAHSSISSSSYMATDPSFVRCRCDDCLLGITDLLATVALYGKPDPDENLSPDDDHVNVAVRRHPLVTRKPSGWRKLRSMVQWTPFVQNFKHRRYQWVQLAGHSGNFKAGRNPETVLKKMCPQEEHCYKQFKSDALSHFVPDYQGNLVIDDEKFIQLQDCLSSFNMPSIMDCKIGVRTYLEEELAKAKEKPKLRKDMYEKMIAVDPGAPSEEEHRLRAVTKPRYMVWRETISSTSTLGFRIEGMKKNDGTSSKEFKTTKTKDQIIESFRNFISGSIETAKQYLDRLILIRHALDRSEFFKLHELIGSSLLFVHDSNKANVWLIDFGKTVLVPEGVHIDHKSQWEVGNHEDGYLIGVENLINLYSELVMILEKEKTHDVPKSRSIRSKPLS